MVPSVLSYLRRYFASCTFPAAPAQPVLRRGVVASLTEEWSRCVPAAQIRNVYGPTEATIFCTEFEWQDQSSAEQSVNDIVPIGRCTPGTEIRVLVDSAGLAVAGRCTR